MRTSWGGPLHRRHGRHAVPLAVVDAVVLVQVVEGKRNADGRWPLETTHPGRVHFDMGEGDGAPSRWNTLRAMRVLAWYRGSPAR
jgi:hypothetical protein